MFIFYLSTVYGIYGTGSVFKQTVFLIVETMSIRNIFISNIRYLMNPREM